jgi:nucleoside-diphosphate-sugar epimerase
MKENRILIIGGAGFIGSWLTHHLYELGQSIIVVDSNVRSYEVDGVYNEKVRDFRASELLHLHEIPYYAQNFARAGTYLMENEKPNIIVNLAATPLEKPFESDESQIQLSGDIMISYDAVSLAKKYKIDKYVYMSSLFAYGDFEGTATEDQLLNPKTPYGISKMVGELLAKSQLTNWNVVRTTSVYGFGDINNRATQIFINKAINDEPFWVNKEAVLDYIYIKDFVEGLAKVILEAPVGEAFHISGGKPASLLEYVQVVQKYYPNMRYEVKSVFDRPKRGSLSNEKAKRMLNWQPRYTLESGVAEYMEHVKKYGYA